MRCYKALAREIRLHDLHASGKQHKEWNICVAGLKQDFTFLDVPDLAAGANTTDLSCGQRRKRLRASVERAGYYHVEVVGDSVKFSTHRGGSAIMTPASGSATPIAANQQGVVIGMESPRVEWSPAPPLTAWDNWNYQRSASLLRGIGKVITR